MSALIDWERENKIADARRRLTQCTLHWASEAFTMRMELVETTEFDKAVIKLAELLNTPEKCPTCNQEVHGEHG